MIPHIHLGQTTPPRRLLDPRAGSLIVAAMTTTLERHEPAALVQSAARRWLAPVREKLNENFLSAYITGGALHEGFDPEHRHVNVLVVTQDLPVGRLDVIAGGLTHTTKPPHIDPMFLTMQQVQRSLDVFPIEWLDLKERHWVLEGVDLFDTVDVPQTYLRLQVEQELRGKHLRLVQEYITGAAHPERLHGALARLASGFHTLFRSLIRLHDEAAPPSLERTIARVAELYDLDAQALGGAHRMRAQRRRPSADETRATYRSFLAQVERLVAAVDGLHVS